VALKLITAPAAEPLTAAEVKTRLGIGSEVADTTVAAWIKSARETLDGANGMLGRALITQTWELVLDGFPCGYWRGCHYVQPDVEMPLPRLQSVTSVKYLDANGTEQTVDAGVYRVITGERGRIALAVGSAWPTPLYGQGAVTIRFVAGYGSAGSDVPEPIRQAIVLGVSLSRSLTGQNLFVRSETVDGVGSRDFSGGTQASATIADQIERLISGYRVGAGIS
jgi:uncharacterized phiE125 gp8 family phage protein